MNMEERKYIENYHIEQYERPSVAADIAIFSILDEGLRESNKKLQRQKLKILLIQRGAYPYKGLWALPGGFCTPYEDVCDTARRELKEETGVEPGYMKLVGAYGGKGRDPRGWIISNTFMALMNGANCRLKSGSDAGDAKWFVVDLQVENYDINQIRYTLQLSNEKDKLHLKAVILEQREFHNNHFHSTFSLAENDGLAFDHARIITDAVLMLRREVTNNYAVAFDLMPDKFTLTQLQNALEILLVKKLLPANFRRKIADYVVETEEIVEGEGFRPAKLFRRNQDATL